MKHTLSKGKNLAWVLILVGFGLLMGMLLNGRRGLVDRVIRSNVERVLVRDVAEEIVVGERIAIRGREAPGVPEIIVRPEEPILPIPTVPPVPPIQPLPPDSIANHVVIDGFGIASFLNNLVAVALILIGVWLIVRHSREPREKKPQ